MDPFEIRTIPARMRPVTIVVSLLMLVAAMYVLGSVLWTTVAAARHIPEDPARWVMVCAAFLLLGCALAWVYFRWVGPAVQVILMYVFRDRGKQALAYRLDQTGWRHVIAGADVAIPWAGMDVAVTERSDDRFSVTVTSAGPLTAARDPLSRQLRRTLRKQRGFTAPLTLTNPTEDELAAEIQRQSGGRVALRR
jgi:hypothetical protein